MDRFLRALVVVVAACVLGGCPPVAEEEPPPVFYAPDADGPWVAGTAEHAITSREGVGLDLQIWYPADSFGDEPYRYDDVFEGAAASWSTADCSTVRPVVVFSHGNGGIPAQTYTVMERLASHGWVVAAPGHTFNTTYDLDSDRWLEVALRRPWDVADAFDAIADPGSGLAGAALDGCVDEAAGYAVMGHSFGGFTSYATAGALYDVGTLGLVCDAEPQNACDTVAAWADAGDATADRSDDRVWAAVPWAPAWWESFGEHLGAIDVPVLVIGADRDAATTWEEDVRPSFDALTATPRYLAQIEDAGHFSFTDACAFLDFDDGCTDDFRPPEEVIGLTATMSLAFLRHVRGDDRAADWLPPAAGLSSWEAVD